MPPAVYRALATETDETLRRHVLGMWFPRAVDRERGGFHQNFGEDWSRGAGGGRSVVYQARLTWVAAQAAGRYPGRGAEFRGYTRHGLAFLSSVLWDREQGGFFWEVGPAGKPDAGRGTEKHVYGTAFGIYAAAAAYAATKDTAALGLAKRAFAWLDARAHDRRNGGYYEALRRDGTPILAPPTDASRRGRAVDAIGTRYGYKSMNTHIHLLEAFAALYEVWRDAALRARLEEVFKLVRDRVAVAPPGCLHLFFTPDWRPLPDHDSFGHDVETAYLLVEAAEALGRPDDARAWSVARQLVDHALAFGWDAEHGGFYDTGGVFGPPANTAKVWWVQAEGLNALLLMHRRFGRETPRYWEAFLRQWAFLRDHQTDARHGGWHPEVTRAGKPTPGRGKSYAWTEAYHPGRALLNVSAALRRLAGAPPNIEKRHP